MTDERPKLEAMPVLCLGPRPAFLRDPLDACDDAEQLEAALRRHAGRAQVFLCAPLDSAVQCDLHRQFPEARFWCEHARPCADAYARGPLLRALSHAVRSPLGVVEGAFDELRARSSEPEALEWAMLRRGLARLKRLATTLADAGELEAAPEAGEETGERVVLADAVRRAWEDAAAQLPLRREVELELRAAPGAAAQGLDGRRLVRALRELLVNARQNARGRVHVAVETGPHGALRLDVEDDGPGPGPAVQRGTWERFVSAKQRGVASDLGLGLGIVADEARRLGLSFSVTDLAPGTRARLARTAA